MTQPLTPWVPLEQVLKIYAPELIDPVSGEIIHGPATIMWATAINQATWMMWALSGGKVHPAETWVEEYSLIGSCEVIPLNGPLQLVLSAELIESCPHLAAGTPLEFCQDYQRVNFCCSPEPRLRATPYEYNGAYRSGMSYSCGCHTTWVRITYRTDSTLPPGTEGRIAWFADQYMKSINGDKSCSLPERITSVTRQGVSWSMLDPMDFLDKKLTGVGRLDSWLTTVRLQYPASQLIDPLRSQRRMSRRQLSQGEDMGLNEVVISTDVPVDPNVELWFDPDAQAGDPIPVTPKDAEMEKVG